MLMTDILSDDERFAAIEEGKRQWQRGQHMVRGTTMSPIDDINYCKALAVERAVISRLAAMGGELPSISPHDHPEPQTTMWTGLEIAWIHDCARAERAKGIAAGMAQERARCVAVCGGLAEDTPALGDGEYAKGWRDALGTAEHAISKPAPDEKEQTR